MPSRIAGRPEQEPTLNLGQVLGQIADPNRPTSDAELDLRQPCDGYDLGEPQASGAERGAARYRPCWLRGALLKPSCVVFSHVGEDVLI